VRVLDYRWKAARSAIGFVLHVVEGEIVAKIGQIRHDSDKENIEEIIKYGAKLSKQEALPFFPDHQDAINKRYERDCPDVIRYDGGLQEGEDGEETRKLSGSSKPDRRNLQDDHAAGKWPDIGIE
jgi:hypothetical protein